MGNFDRQYLQQPMVYKSTPADEAVEEYHKRCDEYDAKVCTAMRNGEPHPHPNGSVLDLSVGRYITEMSAINKHAGRVRREVLSKYGITWLEFSRANRRK